MKEWRYPYFGDNYMADGKWIEQVKATTPLTEAASQVLLARLKVVSQYLPKALHEAEKDPEYVHQLRVGTRRADAALRIFAPCLPGKVVRRARKRLRRIRRAAGVARDLDVFALHLRERQQDQPEVEQPGLDFLLGHTLAQRSLAQTQLLDAGQRDGLQLEDFLDSVILAVRPLSNGSNPATLMVLARPLLSVLLHTLEEKAAGDITEYPHLHEVRIAGKRFRYAMEVFAPCFGPPFRQTHYPLIEEMQEILGRANDGYVAGERLKSIRDPMRAAWPDAWPRLAPGLEALLRFHQKQLPLERRRFLSWWKRWQEQGLNQLKEMLIAGAVI